MSLAGIDLSIVDLVKETTQTIGTGAYELDGASTGFRSFSAAGDGAKVPYSVRFSSDWENGIGTVTTGATTTLSRDVILDSSSGGAAVNWGSGIKDIRIDIPADWFAKLRPSQAQLQPASNNSSVLVVRNAAGGNRIVGAIAGDGSGDFDVRNTGGTATVTLDGSAGNVTASGTISGAEVKSGGTTIQPAPSAQLAKGWVKFTVSGVIRASHNVSSITDHGSADWTVNWSTSFASGHYAVSTAVNVDQFAVRMSLVRIQSAGALRVNSFSAAGQGEANITDIFVIAFGSQ